MQSDKQVVLVTGGAGFIGSHLTERLVRDGFVVRVLDDFSTGRAENICEVAPQIELFEGSILDRRLLLKAAQGCECIFHLAAVVSVPASIECPEYTHEVNATGTFAVIEAARMSGSRVILSSSAAVYGEVLNPIQSEDLPLSPISPYGVQKCLGELYLRSYHRVHGLEGFALRYFNVYGKRQDHRSPYSGVISIFCDRARKGEELVVHGTGLQTRDYVHVSDVVEANIGAMLAPNADGSGLNVGTGRPIELNRLAHLILQHYERGGPVRYEEPRRGDIANSCAHVKRAEHRLGFKSRMSLEHGLESMIAENASGLIYHS